MDAVVTEYVGGSLHDSEGGDVLDAPGRVGQGLAGREVLQNLDEDT